VTSARLPVLEVRLAFVAADGSVRAWTRLRWATSPSAAALVDAVASRARDARRWGLSLHVVAASPGVTTLLMLAGICGPDGPVVVDVDAAGVDRDRSGSDLRRQPEGGEQ
jgi:hypothetical protein